MQHRKLLETLQKLAESRCLFIVVGGVAAVLNGAPVQTFDIDIVYSASAENIERLLSVLASLDAVFRIQPDRRIKRWRAPLIFVEWRNPVPTMRLMNC